MTELKTQIQNGTSQLAEIASKKKAAETDLAKYLEEKKITLDRVARALRVSENLDKVGLSIEEGEIVGNVLKVFCDLVQSEGLTPEKAGSELSKFLKDMRSLEDSHTKLKHEVDEYTTNKDSLKAEAEHLESEKKKLTLENALLTESIDSVSELREKHGIGVDAILKIRNLAKKYGHPSSILEALDTYKSLEEIKEQKTRIDESVKELTRTETSLKAKLKIAEDELTSLPAKTKESIEGIKSSIKTFSEQVQGLGNSIEKASTNIDELKGKALDAGREIAAVESQVKAYKSTSKLIDFIVKGKGEETDVVEVAIGFLGRLSEWVQNQSKYSGTKQQIESLRDMIERQLIHG